MYGRGACDILKGSWNKINDSNFMHANKTNSTELTASAELDHLLIWMEYGEAWE
jgi:hypothetical protein